MESSELHSYVSAIDQNMAKIQDENEDLRHELRRATEREEKGSHAELKNLKKSWQAELASNEHKDESNIFQARGDDKKG